MCLGNISAKSTAALPCYDQAPACGLLRRQLVQPGTTARLAARMAGACQLHAVQLNGATAACLCDSAAAHAQVLLWQAGGTTQLSSAAACVPQPRRHALLLSSSLVVWVVGCSAAVCCPHTLACCGGAALAGGWWHRATFLHARIVVRTDIVLRGCLQGPAVAQSKCMHQS